MIDIQIRSDFIGLYFKVNRAFGTELFMTYINTIKSEIENQNGIIDDVVQVFNLKKYKCRFVDQLGMELSTTELYHLFSGPDHLYPCHRKR